MSNERISDIIPGTPPYGGATLVEIAIPAGGGNYSSRSALYSDLVPATMRDQLTIDWDSNTQVAAGTAIALGSSQWASATILSCYCLCVSGSFNVAIEINGTPVTGLGAVAVNGTPATSNATGGNTIATGNSVSVVISGVSGAPTTAVIQINLSRSFN